MDFSNRNFDVSAAFLGALALCGVRHVVVCPGSRSAPLAVAAARIPELSVWPRIDERSAGFFGLGLAKASRSPVALICTSGTAAANFLPAVVEACYARTPLIVLSADRPAELREWGAGQTVDQVRMYGSHVRWFSEMPTPEGDPERFVRHARATARRVVEIAAGENAGPVHVNFPFRDPLHPTSDWSPELSTEDRVASASARFADRASSPEDRAWLFELVLAHERGAVVCGPCDRPDLAEAVAAFAHQAGWPLMADATSQLRRGPDVEGAPLIARADTLLRSESFAAAHAPDVVVRIGSAPVGKFVGRWLAGGTQVVFMGPEARWQDPEHRATRQILGDPEDLLRSVARRLDQRDDHPRRTDWRADFETADAVVRRELEYVQDAAPLHEPAVVAELASAIPDDGALFVSNSMPIRDLELALDPHVSPLRIFCNRGANGIDGIVSSALGTAQETPGPTALLTGDLALIHDLSGLRDAARASRGLLIVAINNNGGGIFSHLPVAETARPLDFEQLFRTPHDLDLEPLARGLGLHFVRPSSTEHLRASLKDGLRRRGTSLIEVRVDPNTSLRVRRELDARVRARLEAIGS